MSIIIPPEELNVFKAIAAKEAKDNKDKKENDTMQNNTNELINLTNHNGQIVVSSREVAERFEKRHDNVLMAIKEAVKGLLENEDTPSMFFKTTYTHPQNGQDYPEYLMTRDGFSLLAMGFTGTKAFQWKLKYINAFNRMEAELKKTQASYQIDDPIARAERWIEEQREKKAALLALEEAKPKVETYDKLISHKGYVGLREMSKMLGYPLNKMGAFVCEIEMCYKENGIYYPYAEFSRNGMCVGKWHRAKWGSHGGMKTVFSLEGVEYVRKALQRIGWKPNKK